MKKPRIPEDMQKRIERMALRTWDQIGGDSLRCLEECGEPAVMDRDAVVETVCDASYMETYGGDLEAYKFWDKLPTYTSKKKCVAKAFPFETYGM